MNDKPIGEIIKERRIALGMTQEQLAQKIGYKSKSTINKIELGINDISQKKIVKFAEALDTTVAYLMGWSDDPHRRASAIHYNEFHTFQHDYELTQKVERIDGEEEEIIFKYRQSDPKIRGAIKAILEIKDNDFDINITYMLLPD